MLDLRDDFQMVVNGETVSGGDTLPVYNPATEEVAPKLFWAALQNSMQFEKGEQFFEDRHDSGYRLVTGGEIDEGVSGWFVPASLVDNRPEDSMPVVEQPFGPIRPFLRWTDDDDGIRRANDTIWGSAASV